MRRQGTNLKEGVQDQAWPAARRAKGFMLMGKSPEGERFLPNIFQSSMGRKLLIHSILSIVHALVYLSI